MIQLGNIVRSLAGRDKDKYFIVIQIIDKDYVRIADGDLRKVEHPKKKKIKHLKTVKENPEIQQKILENSKINNAFIKNILKDLGYL